MSDPQLDMPPSRSAGPQDWFKSTHSAAATSCVEVRISLGVVLIRDSKDRLAPGRRPARQPVIALTPGEWTAFLRHAHSHSGRSVAGRVAILTEADGTTVVRCQTTGTALRYLPAEWLAFTAGIAEGEFDLPRAA